jgi:3-oxoacyl-[acyl-carrier-protein] synthase II
LSCIIQGIGLLGGFGYGQSSLLAACEQHSERRHQWIEMKTSKGTERVPVLLSDTSSLSGYMSKAAMRRLNHYSRMALLAAFSALDDADVLYSRPRRLGIIVCSGYGATINTSVSIDSKKELSDIFGSPTKFASSVHNATAGIIAMALKETGPNLTVSQYDMSVPQGLMTAQIWIAEKRVDAVLVGGVDGCCYELSKYRHTLMADNDGFGAQPSVVGEGASFLLLVPKQNHTQGYARIQAFDMGLLRSELSEPDLSSQIVILGADGYNDYEQNYRQLVRNASWVANYTSIYGILPVGMIFDVAIAAMALCNKEMYPSILPVSPVSLQNKLAKWQLVETRQSLNTDCIRCLKLGNGGFYAWIDLCQC